MQATHVITGNQTSFIFPPSSEQTNVLTNIHSQILKNLCSVQKKNDENGIHQSAKTIATKKCRVEALHVFIFICYSCSWFFSTAFWQDTTFLPGAIIKQVKCYFCSPAGMKKEGQTQVARKVVAIAWVMCTWMYKIIPGKKTKLVKITRE